MSAPTTQAAGSRPRPDLDVDGVTDKAGGAIHEEPDWVAAIEQGFHHHHLRSLAAWHDNAPMPASADRTRAPARGCSDLVALMEDWPQSWAGVEADLKVGQGLIAPMRAFLMHLHARGLSRTSLRRHVHHLWAIGGEILREVNDEPRLRRRPPAQLLLDAIAEGEAPVVYGATEAEQRPIDATARQLLRFLTATPPGA